MPHHPNIVILGYSEAAMFMQQPDAAEVRAIIAIGGQREYTIDTNKVEHSLILNFDDTKRRLTMIYWVRHAWLCDNAPQVSLAFG